MHFSAFYLRELFLLIFFYFSQICAELIYRRFPLKYFSQSIAERFLLEIFRGYSRLNLHFVCVKQFLADLRRISLPLIFADTISRWFRLNQFQTVNLIGSAF